MSSLKYKDSSLLEIAVDLLSGRRKSQSLDTIIKDVMSLKGIKAAQAKELAPQFAVDFMLSGIFVYCGDGTWDLKERQSTDVLDSEGGDYEVLFDNDDEVIKNELRDDISVYTKKDVTDSDDVLNDDEEDDEEDEEDEDVIAEEIGDELTNEFDIDSTDAEDEEDEEDDEDEEEFLL